MKPEDTKPQDESKVSSRRSFFTAAAAAGTALAATAAAGPLTGGGSAELKSRLMSRIQDELKTADQSELHSYDRDQTAHTKYVKA